MDIDEVNHMVPEETVAHVAQRPPDEEAEGQLATAQFTHQGVAPTPHQGQDHQCQEDEERANVILRP